MGRWLKMLRHTIVYCANCQQRSSVLSFNVHTSGSAARHPSLYLALGPGFVRRKVTTSAMLTQRSCCLLKRLPAAGPSLGSELAGTMLCGL